MKEMTIFGLEKLEDRTLLAVTIARQKSTLTVTSDGADDQIEISTDVYGNVLVVVDEDDDGDVDYVYYAAPGVRNITVNAGYGDDVVLVTGLDIAANLTVNLGYGDDVFYMGYFAYAYGQYYGGTYGASDIGGILTVRGQDGDDVIVALDSDVGKTVVIEGGDDDDVVVLGAAYADLDVDKGVKVDLGAGYDVLVIYGYGYGYGVDIGGNLNILGGSEDDDVIIVGDVDVAKGVVADLGGGDDYIYIGGYGTNANIVVFGGVNLKLGSGDDYAYVYGYTYVYGKTTVDGGAGYDVLGIEYDNYFIYGNTVFNGPVVLKNLELVLFP